MKKYTVVTLILSFLWATAGLAQESITLDFNEIIKHVSTYPTYLAKREKERDLYRRRISRESQILREKLEKFKFESPTMSPSVKKVEEEELKKYSNVVRKLDYRLKTEIDERDAKEYKKVKDQLKKEIRKFGKKKKVKAIFSADKEKLLFRGRGVSPLTIKVLKNNKKIPDFTEKFVEWQKKKNK